MSPISESPVCKTLHIGYPSETARGDQGCLGSNPPYTEDEDEAPGFSVSKQKLHICVEDEDLVSDQMPQAAVHRSLEAILPSAAPGTSQSCTIPAGSWSGKIHFLSCMLTSLAPQKISSPRC